MLKLSFIESFKNISKNRVLTFLTAVLLTALFVLEGFTLSYIITDAKYTAVINNKTFATYGLYRFSSGYNTKMLNTVDPDFFSGGIERLRMAYQFYEALDGIEHLKYTYIDDGSVRLGDFKGNPLIFGTDIESLDQVCYYKAIQASYNFNKNEDYRIIEGRDFTDEDMVYKEGEPLPVLLGYKYKGVYSPGDILVQVSDTAWDEKKELLYGSSELKVIGILAEDTAVIPGQSDRGLDLDTYIVIPQQYIPMEILEASSDDVIDGLIGNFHFRFLNTKLMIDSAYEADVTNSIQQALKGYAGYSKYYKLENLKQATLLAQSKVRSRALFCVAIMAVLMLFSVSAIVIAVINRVSRNIRDYAVHITVGATKANTVGFTVFETLILLIFSAIVSLIILPCILANVYMFFNIPFTLAFFAASSLFILVVSAAAARFALSKYDICSLIK